MLWPGANSFTYWLIGQSVINRDLCNPTREVNLKFYCQSWVRPFQRYEYAATVYISNKGL